MGPLLTTRQVAETLNLSQRTVRRLSAAGELQRIRLGYNTVRYRAEDVAAFIEARQVA